MTDLFDPATWASGTGLSWSKRFGIVQGIRASMVPAFTSAGAGQGNGLVERPFPTLRTFHQPAAACDGFQSGGMRSPRSKRRYLSAVQSR
jgi:hypothetical protein